MIRGDRWIHPIFPVEEPFEIGPRVLLVFTFNPSHYAGRSEIDPRLLAPMVHVWMENPTFEESARIIETFYGVWRDDPAGKTEVVLAGAIPRKIRAPYVDRDNVIGTDDNVAVFLDTRNDRRSAVELRVSPRGIQGDAIYNDANGNEDFSPDFYYDTAARITDSGWQAEMRVPLSTLRYPKTSPQSWGILIWRNYPRDYRYAIYSSPEPRGANCLLCRSRELTGITGLPSSSHLVLAPYASGQDVARAPAPGEPLGDAERDGNLGFDLKWGPTADTALDATINPDFSQIEADVAQIAVNNRFALFYPEKRPFFLEGTDLFDTPLHGLHAHDHLAEMGWPRHRQDRRLQRRRRSERSQTCPEDTQGQIDGSGAGHHMILWSSCPGCEGCIHSGCCHMGTLVVLASMTFPGQLKGGA